MGSSIPRSLAMPGGRPTLYQPETAEIARHACMLGGTNETLAERFEVSRRTVDTWIATLPAFRNGRQVADKSVVSPLFARGRRARPGAAGDPVAEACRRPAQGNRRLRRRRPARAALGRQPGADWRSACGNCGNSMGLHEYGCAHLHGALHTADWCNACANCGNLHRTVTCSSRLRLTRN
jgi:hypothetical protein